MSYDYHCGRLDSVLCLIFSLVKDADRRKVDVRCALTRKEVDELEARAKTQKRDFFLFPFFPFGRNRD